MTVHNEQDFRHAAQAALASLKRHLLEREQEDHAAFEVEEHNGALTVLFDRSEDKFVIAPNEPVRQIWVTAPSSSVQLNWDSRMEDFIHPHTGELLNALINRLISEHHSPSTN